jgi:altronate dehydratase small subunit
MIHDGRSGQSQPFGVPCHQKLHGVLRLRRYAPPRRMTAFSHILIAMPTEPRFIRLHSDDNVLTVATPIAAEQIYCVGDWCLSAVKPIGVGFKIAASPIPAGAKVIKYGAIIGTATCDIAPGEVVHTHNLTSDYLPTYLRGESEVHIK